MIRDLVSTVDLHSASATSSARGRDIDLDLSGIEFTNAGLLGPRVADLVDVSLAVYLADRTTRRPGMRDMASGLSWSRDIRLRIGVRDLAFWRSHCEQLAELLHWLTDDEWACEFVPFEGESYWSEVQPPLSCEVDEACDAVGLFSGGLDSLAGAIHELEFGGPMCLVSVETNSRMGAAQRRLRECMRLSLPAFSVATASVQIHADYTLEVSQRGRAILFLVLAGAVATCRRADVVEVFENGVGAIALPLVPTQEGAHTTKAMHPETLALVSRLVSEVAERQIDFANPSLWLTKGQLCERIPRHLNYLIPMSESCDTAYSYRGSAEPRCGLCTSCLLRRQALWAAGRRDLDARQSIRCDVLGACEGSDLAQLIWMLDQAERINSALEQPDPWAALEFRFPELLRVVSSPEDRIRCLRLYETYVEEWRRFPAPPVSLYFPNERNDPRRNGVLKT